MTFLITFILIILFFRLVMPHLLRWAIKAFVKKTIRNGTFMNASGPFTQPGPEARSQSEPEGKVKVDYVPQNGRKTKAREFRGGEYVDYEEVK
jgi:hypothetical protein